RGLNRMNDTIAGARVEGEISLDGEDIYRSRMDVVQLRARVGMVFQKPNPFPKSIYENIAYGPRIHGLTGSRAESDAIVEQSLQRAGSWDEVKDRLSDSGTALSGGQQQRLCIARAIAVDPEVISMDEPCSALDPIAILTSGIQDITNTSVESFRSPSVSQMVSETMFRGLDCRRVVFCSRDARTGESQGRMGSGEGAEVLKAAFRVPSAVSSGTQPDSFTAV
ncbi:hypothetical protein OY671_009193, partial [Metschnikowia pulcherrima]